ncbi:MAG: hypothetical protein KF785_07235 [Gemmatimonadales bacterium]|nr:hypothetical protein [Gemmatimonadales bacterium]
MHRLIAVGATLTTLAGCAGERHPSTRKTETSATIVTVREVYQTERDTLLDIDSPAVWHGPNGEHWMLVTAKQGDIIRVADASTGRTLRDVGGSGSEPGRFERPNGIAVIDSLLFVVERDNARVQVMTLPDFRPIGIYGTPELIKPYGVAVRQQSPGVYETWITDSYELVEDQVPPDSALGRRVRQYRVSLAGGTIETALVATFGDTAGAGVLRVVESIAVDPPSDRLMIAEELEGESQIKAYTLAGRFTGATIPASYFPNQAEGIVLFACADGGGLWITTDQGKVTNTFHLFDRRSLDHRGSFQSPTILNTDGIALTQVPFPGFPAGALFAVHDDGGVAAISWEAIAGALGLPMRC